MMRGTVNARLKPVVRLRVRGPTGVIVTVDAVVDTGCAAAHTLPPAVITRLGLDWLGGGQVMLANGSKDRSDIYEADVEWCSVWRTILVREMKHFLLGMGLIDGHQLRVNAVPGGAVEIDTIP